ncbi:bacterioferritin-associated ferredoxin [Pedobacter ginsengisoli]|uniref:(2Fe-2S)-binding protein n=1 Tax=Pedobacter ginsengisoli TaxID=363852 RepID=UPI002936EE82|nr:(2Fe-2S)-binding protein [Pedobacter ginsengisoli]
MKGYSCLEAAKKNEPVSGKLVCSCNNVGAGNILNKITSGCSDFKKLCESTGAGMGCGSCKPEVKLILQEALKEEVLEK